MTRRLAADRHRASAPDGHSEGRAHEPVDVLIAFHHPTRRWLVEVLGVEGPASVGRLAARTGLAVGSVSHHLKSLHKHGFIEPAPELARDTRESWWRSTRRPLSWSVADFSLGSADRELAAAAEAENFRHQVRAVQQWLASDSRSSDAGWRRAASSSHTMTSASQAELADLGDRLAALVEVWSAECAQAARPSGDTTETSKTERRSVRVITRAFPSGAVRP